MQVLLSIHQYFFVFCVFASYTLLVRTVQANEEYSGKLFDDDNDDFEKQFSLSFNYCNNLISACRPGCFVHAVTQKSFNLKLIRRCLS